VTSTPRAVNVLRNAERSPRPSPHFRSSYATNLIDYAPTVAPEVPRSSSRALRRGTAEAAAAATQGPVRASRSYDTGGPRGTGILEIQVDPARTGPDTINITVHDPRGASLDLPELDAEISLPDHHLGPLPLTVKHHGPGHYQATGQIPLPGTWQLTLTLRTSDIDETTVRLPIPIH
jgi:hypothetical protein